MDSPPENRVLLLMTTATYRANAFLEAAEALRVPVVVGSDRRQVLSRANPEGHLTLPFAKPDDAARDILEFHRLHRLGAIVAADDDGVILAAMVSHAVGLRHHPPEAVRSARDKYRMRRVLSAAGLPSPEFRCVAIGEDPALHAERVRYPSVLKPLHLSAGRGVIRADDPVEFVEAFRRIQAILAVSSPGTRQAQHVLVEEFIPGIEVAVEGLVTAGRLDVLAHYDKPDPLDGPYFEETLYVTPSRHALDVQRRIRESVASAVAALGLTHGPVHAEVRYDGREAWIVEIAPRSIGGLCSRTLRFGGGISLEELLLRHALGRETAGLEREGVAAGVMMIPIPARGVLHEVRGLARAGRVEGIEEIRITIPTGHEVSPPPEGSRYLGFIFSRAGTPDSVETALREAHRRLEFVIS